MADMSEVYRISVWIEIPTWSAILRFWRARVSLILRFFEPAILVSGERPFLSARLATENLPAFLNFRLDVSRCLAESVERLDQFLPRITEQPQMPL